MIIFDSEGNAVGDTKDFLDKVDGDIDLDVALGQLDVLHENWLVASAELDSQISELLGSKFAAFVLLREKRSMLDKNYSDKKEQLRKEILAPAIISRATSARSRFFRVEYSQGSESVNRGALREWADNMGLRERVENFITRASPFIKIVSLKGE